MHTVEVSLQVDIEAKNPYVAEEAAWNAVKAAVASVPTAKVIAAHARPR